MNPTIYMAWAENADIPPTFLGTYEGNLYDVEALVKSTKNIGYGLSLEEVKPIKVVEGTAGRLKKLNDRKRELEKELATVKQQLVS